jgi:NAD(P)-dependent dehydrogenase (short-subunit alcohol dehydrogenase family)
LSNWRDFDKMRQQVLDWLEKKTGELRDRILATREQSTPLKRMATTDDVVNAVRFFISDETSFLIGEALNVDGVEYASFPGLG